MRCYTFQSKSVVMRWLKIFEQEDVISYLNTADRPERDKVCYSEEDFIYTFYRSGYDSDDYKKAWLKDNYYLTNVLKWYFNGFDYNDLIMIEIIVPDNIGLFGELENKKILSKDTVKATNILVELVIPYLHKDWIVDYYTFKEIPDISANKGIEIIPGNYKMVSDKLIYSNAPLIWDTSDDNCDPLCTDVVYTNSALLGEYKLKCKKAFYEDTRQKEETNLF